MILWTYADSVRADSDRRFGASAIFRRDGSGFASDFTSTGMPCSEFNSGMMTARGPWARSAGAHLASTTHPSVFRAGIACRPEGFSSVAVLPMGNRERLAHRNMANGVKRVKGLKQTPTLPARKRCLRSVATGNEHCLTSTDQCPTILSILNVCLWFTSADVSRRGHGSQVRNRKWVVVP